MRAAWCSPKWRSRCTAVRQAYCAEFLEPESRRARLPHDLLWPVAWGARHAVPDPDSRGLSLLSLSIDPGASSVARTAASPSSARRGNVPSRRAEGQPQPEGLSPLTARGHRHLFSYDGTRFVRRHSSPGSRRCGRSRRIATNRTRRFCRRQRLDRRRPMALGGPGPGFARSA